MGSKNGKPAVTGDPFYSEDLAGVGSVIDNGTGSTEDKPMKHSPLPNTELPDSGSKRSSGFRTSPWGGEKI